MNQRVLCVLQEGGIYRAHMWADSTSNRVIDKWMKKKNKEIAATETATVKIEHFSSTQEFIVQLSIYSKQQKSSRENKITKCFVKSAFKRKTATKNTPKNTEHSKLQATAQNCNMNTKNWKKRIQFSRRRGITIIKIWVCKWYLYSDGCAIRMYECSRAQ